MRKKNTLPIKWMLGILDHPDGCSLLDNPTNAKQEPGNIARGIEGDGVLFFK